MASTATNRVEAFFPKTELDIVSHLSLVDSRSSFTVLGDGQAGDLVGEHVAFSQGEMHDDPARCRPLWDPAHGGRLRMYYLPPWPARLCEHRAQVTVADGRKLMSSQNWVDQGDRSEYRLQ